MADVKVHLRAVVHLVSGGAEGFGIDELTDVAVGDAGHLQVCGNDGRAAVFAPGHWSHFIAGKDRNYHPDAH